MLLLGQCACLMYVHVFFLFYRHKCFTEKYTTRKIHMKPYLGPEWHIFHILTSEGIKFYSYQVCLLNCSLN